MGEPTRDEPTRSLRSNTLLSDEPTAQKLFNTIRKSILDTNHSIDLTFQNIAPTSGSLIVASLAEDPDIERSLPRLSYNSVTRVLTARIMPTHVHDCHQEWLCFELGQMRMAGFLSPAEARLIKFRVGTSGRPHVQLVFLIKWAKLSGGRIKGDIEIHGRDMSGNAILLQTEGHMQSETMTAFTSLAYPYVRLLSSYISLFITESSLMERLHYTILDLALKGGLAPQLLTQYYGFCNSCAHQQLRAPIIRLSPSCQVRGGF
ncbi:hypothetical protein I7I51_02840 [Histoplasma capsulatum]|uniref:Uncharacterized protein n=1 Tax=Ajellomyces capsulatus TaxID=5037 RepID=A0A8A1MN81_AJECA|nr:hypothetical protein I7I51_02840 [Histoplasma capsulatum]